MRSKNLRATARRLRVRWLGRVSKWQLLPSARAYVRAMVPPMTLAKGARLEELAVAYAKHRTALHLNAKAIKQVQEDAEGTYFDLASYRDRYWSGEVHDMPLGGCIVWHGWLHAVETCQQWDDIEQDDDCGYRATAILMDERREIKRDGARIRAAFTKIGNQLLRTAP